MKTTPETCSQCQVLEVKVAALEAELGRVRAQLAAAKKNSETSSTPPSSDIVKPAKPQPPPGQERRKIGGQPGHTAHQRELFPPEMLASAATDDLLDACPGCGGHPHLTDAEPIRVVQQLDVLDVPLEIHEHRGHPSGCPHGRETHYARLPLSIERGGMAGPRLTTVIAYLKGACHASFSTIRKFIFFSEYRRYHREFGVAPRFCLAHLIRDVKYLTTLPAAGDRAYGGRLLGGPRSLFAVIHRRDDLSERDFQSQLEAARARVLRLGTRDVPATRACLNLAKWFQAHGES